MRRLKAIRLLLSLIMLFSFSVFMAPPAGASSSGDINNFSYGILTDNLSLSSAMNGNINVCGTNSVTYNGAFCNTGNILSGGPVSITGSIDETGNIYSVGNASLSGAYIVNGNIDSMGTISASGGILNGSKTPNIGSLPVSMPTTLPQPDWTYYSSTCNPTVLTPTNGKISSVYSKIHGGTYYINGNVTWDQAIASFPYATTVVVNGTITVTGAIDIGNGGGLALIAYDGINLSGALNLNGVLLWAGGYDGKSNVYFNGAMNYTGDIVSKNGISINGAVNINQEGTIPVAPPLKPASPTVTGINPNSGPTTGGTSVAITGSGFTGATAVKFGSTTATSYIVNSDTSITATSPAGTGTVNVAVTTPVGTSTTSSADQFTYVVTVAPTVTGINPNSGPVTGGTSVAITGTGFTGATAVKFGSTTATSYIVNSSTSVTATSPAESAGTVDVTVTTPAGTSPTSSADQFTYNPALSISATGVQLPPCLADSIYNSRAITNYVTASGGTPSYAWSVSGLPSTMSMNQTTEVLSGYLLTAGAYNVTVTVTDSTGTQNSVQLTLYVYPVCNR